MELKTRNLEDDITAVLDAAESDNEHLFTMMWRGVSLEVRDFFLQLLLNGTAS